jgi:hypothetical protein
LLHTHVTDVAQDGLEGGEIAVNVVKVGNARHAAVTIS